MASLTTEADLPSVPAEESGPARNPTTWYTGRVHEASRRRVQKEDSIREELRPGLFGRVYGVDPSVRTTAKSGRGWASDGPFASPRSLEQDPPGLPLVSVKLKVFDRGDDELLQARGFFDPS